MDEVIDILDRWFAAEYRLKTVVESGRTTEGSRYYQECEADACNAREELAELIVKGSK